MPIIILPNGKRIRTTATFRIYSGFLCWHGKHSGCMRTVRLYDIERCQLAFNQNGSQTLKNFARRKLMQYVALCLISGQSVTED